ncbi:MAG: IS1595 family transposase [Alphaproteobacteria bacterium]
MEGIDPKAAELRAIDIVEKRAWPHGPVCPHCGGSARIYRITGKSARLGLRKCGACRRQFTVRVGTIFEGSHIPLHKWLLAIFMMCTSQTGVSAAQLQRSLEISYKSAWLLCQRVRHAKGQEPSVGAVVERDRR